MIHIELRCDAAGCAAKAALPFDAANFDATVMVHDNDGDILIETPWMSAPEGWSVADDDRVFCPVHPHGSHDCEANLKAMPNYSPGRGTPAVFVCSCGKRYEYVSEESEGASWVLVEKAA